MGLHGYLYTWESQSLTAIPVAWKGAQPFHQAIVCVITPLNNDDSITIGLIWARAAIDIGISIVVLNQTVGLLKPFTLICPLD